MSNKASVLPQALGCVGFHTSAFAGHTSDG
jgi:hypothetical protein